jgi:heterodisulfide reductase subunit C
MSLNLKNNPLKSQDSSKNAITLARKLAFLQEQALSCTRCGACLQGCVSYKTRNMENFSPRGRVQLLKLLLERKIDLKQNEEMLLKCIDSCAQCGQCSKFCAANLKVENLIFELKNFFIKPASREKFIQFYQKYASFLFPFFIFGKKIKQAKKEETKNLLLTSKTGLKFASSSLALLPFSRVAKQALYLNEVLYTGNKDLLAFILKNLKREIKSFKKVQLFTDNIVMWRFLKNYTGFKKIQFLLPQEEPCVEKENIYIINNNSFREREEKVLPSCLNVNFFVEFTQDILHTPANLFWRSLSVEEEQVFSSALKKYEEKRLVILCAEDKVFFDKIKKKYKIKVDILTLAQIINEYQRRKK